MVKRAVARIGLDPDRFGAHSLWAEFATQGAINGLRTHDLKRQGGWRSDQVLAAYIREAERFRINFSISLGL